MAFLPENGEMHAEGIHSTQTNFGMLSHKAPFPIPSIAPAIVPNIVKNFAEVNGVSILFQVNADRGADRGLDGDNFSELVEGVVWRNWWLPC